MSVQELEKAIESLPPDDWDRLERFIRLLRHVKGPGYVDRVAEAHADFAEGRAVRRRDMEAVVRLQRPAPSDGA